MKIFNKETLSLILSILLILTTINVNVFATTNNQEFETNEENIYIKNFSITGKDEYFSGEEILLNINLSLTNDIGTIKNSYISLEIPKEFVDKNTIKVSDISNLDFNGEILEEEDRYTIKYTFETISSSTKLSIPLRFNTLDYKTPNNYILPIKASFNYSNLSVNDSFDLKIKTGDFKANIYLIDKPIGNIGHSNSKNQKLYAGFIDESTGNLYEEKDKLNIINIGYTLENITKNIDGFEIGNRKFEKLIIEIKLPEGSEFIEQENFGNLYKWEYDDKNNIAKLEDKGINNKDINIGMYHTLSFHDLGIVFPKNKVESEKTVSMKVTGIPHNKGNKEENLIVYDSLSFSIYGKNENEDEILTDFYSYKSSINQIYDHSTYREKEEIDWKLNFSKNFNEQSLEKLTIIDENLDNRLYYKGITISENYFGDYKVKIETIDENGNSNLVADKISVKDTRRFNFNNKDKNIKKIVISIVGPSNITTMDLLDFIIHTGVKEPKEPLIIDDVNEALTNEVIFEVQYKNEKQQKTKHNAISTITRIDPKLYLNRKINKGINTPNKFFINELVNMNLSLGVEHIVEGSDKIYLDSIIEILPDGINYVENSSKVIINDKIKGINNDEKIEPKIVHDYMGTGKTALIWDLEEIYIEGDIRFNDNIEDLITINYDSIITGYAKKGDNIFTGYLKLNTNESYFKPKNPTIDELKINNNQKKEIETNSGRIIFEPPKELLIKKEVKGSLNDNYRLSPNIGHTELGDTVDFKITIINNRDDAIEGLYFLDIFPFKGDGKIFDSTNRSSTLDISLEEVRNIPKEFLIYYTEDIPSEDLISYYTESKWTEDINNLKSVRAIKLELKDGASLESGYNKSFELKFKTPVDIDLNTNHKLVNNVLTATSSDLNFIPSNNATSKISQYLIKGIVFEDVNNNGSYDLNEDEPISGVNITLCDENGYPIENSDGKLIMTKTNSTGEYSIGLKKPGNYQIKFQKINGYEVIEKGDLNNPNSSHICNNTNNEYHSPLLELSTNNKVAIANGGFTKQLINVTVNKVWVNSPDEHPDIKLQLYRNNNAHGDPVILKNETEYTWQDLPFIDENGLKYKYTVDELDVPENYSKSVDGYKITNTYKGNIEPENDFKLIIKEVDENGDIIKIISSFENLTNEEVNMKIKNFKSEDYKIASIDKSKDEKVTVLKIIRIKKEEINDTKPKKSKNKKGKSTREKNKIDETKENNEDIYDSKLNKLNHFEYIQGYPDKSIKPENNITREEVSAVFYRLLNEDYKQTVFSLNNNFKDVSNNRWSNKHISTLANAGILKGYNDGNFKYKNFITRAEVAAIASRFENLDKSNHNFTDIKEHWAEDYIASANKKGWVEGYDDGSFKPDKYISRAEFVTLVNRVLNRGVKNENILEGIKAFTDLEKNKWYYEEFIEAVNGHIFNRDEQGSRKDEVWLELKEFNKDM